jgi:hypothetical protein
VAGPLSQFPEPAEGLFSWLKDVWVPTLIAVITGGLALVGVFASNRVSSRKDAADHEDRLNAAEDKERLDRIQADAAHSDSLTRRFQSLMDGYESRIKDLTDEVSGLRGEVRSLRQALDKQVRTCAGCPLFRSLQQEVTDARPADFPG